MACSLLSQGSLLQTARLSCQVPGRRRPIAQRLMEPLRMVQPNISCQTLARVPHALVVAPIHRLPWTTPPQALHPHVVQGAPAALPTEAHASLLQPRGTRLAGTRGAWVGGAALRPAPAAGLLPRLQTTPHVQRARYRPGPHSPGCTRRSPPPTTHTRPPGEPRCSPRSRPGPPGSR